MGAPDDYYALLGIDAAADAAQLRRAWRKLALRWHPDRAGPHATFIFQRISAAYNVLSDPAARSAYDRERGIGRRPAGDARRPPPDPARRRAPGVMLQRQSGPLNALIASGVARRAEPGVIELFLRADEAAEGGMATISMRVAIRCPACAETAAASCDQCAGTRTAEELFSAWLAIPPGVADGAILHPSVPLRGMLQAVAFRIRVRAGR